MKLQIGIVTLGDYDNYGNRLQNVALSAFLKNNFDVEVHTILNWKNNEPIYKIRGLRDVARLILKINYKFIYLFKRRTNFQRFSKRYTNEYVPKSLNNRQNLANEPFDKLILGSDQVWNFTWQTKMDSEYFTLKGVPERKRIAYAASMGNPPVVEGFEDALGSEIVNFSALSVREFDAADYIEKAFGVKAAVMPDPTLLLSEEEWTKMLNLEQWENQNFVITYLLDGGEKSFVKEINDYARRNGLRVINLVSLKGRDKHFYSADPRMFLNLIKNAESVFTNSFHACAFSTIFGKRLIVDNRRMGGQMSSRMDTLFKITGVVPKYYTGTGRLDTASVAPIDKYKVQKELNNQRRKAFAFLANAINN